MGFKEWDRMEDGSGGGVNVNQTRTPRVMRMGCICGLIQLKGQPLDFFGQVYIFTLIY